MTRWQKLININLLVALGQPSRTWVAVLIAFYGNKSLIDAKNAKVNAGMDTSADSTPFWNLTKQQRINGDAAAILLLFIFVRLNANVSDQ